ncbi:MAG: hypothetical protein H7Z43_08625, partial [Clostridia bacterium]|nr:hypothetical protein [Deltaproteobacteria bacterium]
MRILFNAAVLAVTAMMPAVAAAAINPVYGIGWDTRSATDYGLLQRGVTLPSGTGEISARFNHISVDDAEDFNALDVNFSYGFDNLEIGLET